MSESLFAGLRHWRARRTCQAFGHELPELISDESHPEVVQLTHRPAGISGSCGIVWPITCPRCGVMVSPWDAGYPMVEYTGVAPNIGQAPIELVSITESPPVPPEPPDPTLPPEAEGLPYEYGWWAVGAPPEPKT